MTRKKNTTFQGISVFDVDVDQPTFGRVVEAGIGDTALIFDRATGENGETSVIDHTGSGSGCPLGLPLVNQRIGRSLNLTTPAAKDANGGTGLMIIAPYVIAMPPGEDTLVVEVFMSLEGNATVDTLGPYCRIIEQSTGDELDNRDMIAVDMGDGLTMFTTTFSGLTPGYLFVFPTIDTERVAGGSSTVAIGALEQVIIRHDLGMALNPTIGQSETTALRIGVQTPGATEGLFHRNIATAMFADEDAVDSYMLASWNQNLNALDEFITGRPAAGGPTYVHVDHDGAGSPDTVDPARSRFEAHTRSLYANEGQVALPILCESWGAWMDVGKFTVDLAEPPTLGCLEWYAPWQMPTTTTYLRSAKVIFPDFSPATGASTNLKMGVLIGSDSSAAVSNWAFRATTDTGIGDAGTPVAVTGFSNTLWFVEITNIEFTADSEDLVRVRGARSGAKTGIGELAILSWCLAFKP